MSVVHQCQGFSNSFDTILLHPVQLFLIWTPSWAKWKETWNYHSSIQQNTPLHKAIHSTGNLSFYLSLELQAGTHTKQQGVECLGQLFGCTFCETLLHRCLGAMSRWKDECDLVLRGSVIGDYPATATFSGSALSDQQFRNKNRCVHSLPEVSSRCEPNAWRWGQTHRSCEGIWAPSQSE